MLHTSNINYSEKCLTCKEVMAFNIQWPIKIVDACIALHFSTEHSELSEHTGHSVSWLIPLMLSATPASSIHVTCPQNVFHATDGSEPYHQCPSLPLMSGKFLTSSWLPSPLFCHQTQFSTPAPHHVGMLNWHKLNRQSNFQQSCLHIFCLSTCNGIKSKSFWH